MTNHPTDLKPLEGYVKNDVLHAIEYEMEHQWRKFGRDKQQSIAGYLLILKYEIDEAIDGWMKDRADRNSPLHEIVQVAAVAIQCLNYYGTVGSARTVNDITTEEMREVRLKADMEKYGIDRNGIPKQDIV